MNAITKRLLLVLTLQLFHHVTADTSPRQGRDLYHYGHPEDVKSEYPVLTYPSSHYHREGFRDCPENPLASLFARPLNFLLLKVGAVALVKAILAGLFLLKVPLFFLKLAFLKAFFFPVLIAPLLVHMLAGGQSSMEVMKPMMEEQHGQGQTVPDPAETGTGSGRSDGDDLGARVWRSMKVFAQSEQCMERVACMVGAYTGEAPADVTVSRALQLIERASPATLQPRLMSIREAFKNGVRNGSCSERDFVCHGPRLVIQQGTENMRLI